MPDPGNIEVLKSWVQFEEDYIPSVNMMKGGIFKYAMEINGEK